MMIQIKATNKSKGSSVFFEIDKSNEKILEAIQMNWIEELD